MMLTLVELKTIKELLDGKQKHAELHKKISHEIERREYEIQMMNRWCDVV